MPFTPEQIIGIAVYLEKTRSRQYVGKLTREEGQYLFEYNSNYMKSRNVISLGPEMPLTKQSYRSKALFIPFMDRIPVKENPAYPEYCEAMGISPEETDPLILLGTIAHRGPSWLIFEPMSLLQNSS